MINSMHLKASLHIAFVVSHLLLTFFALVHILFNKRQPLSALVWIIIVSAFPFAGFLLYWFFGFNRIVERPTKATAGASPSRVRLDSPLDQLGFKLTGLTIHPSCSVELLEDGAKAYPAMLTAIAEAKQSIDLLTYIFDMDRVGSRFVQALGKAAKRGVKVRVLVDGIGAWFPGNALRKELSFHGVEFMSFWRTDRIFHQPLLNLRNHRKLMVVDAEEAYTGSLNISERHYKGPLALHPLRALRPRKGSERDIHFRVRGPILNDLCAAFEDDWHAAGGESRSSHPRFQKRRGKDSVRLIRSGPDRSFERIYEMLLGALRLSKKTVDLCTPYFIPDGPLMASLRSLALSGVRVRLFLPREGDQAIVTWASRSYFRELMAAGVEIWQIEGDFVHSKACIIDQKWCLIGSCNLDPRSFRLNFELNLEVRSVDLARQIGHVLERYRKKSRRLDFATIKNHGFLRRLRNNLAKLFSPYL
jgi:cardiolipin synthase